MTFSFPLTAVVVGTENGRESLKLVSKIGFEQMVLTNFRLEHSVWKNRTTFSDIPLLPEFSTGTTRKVVYHSFLQDCTFTSIVIEYLAKKSFSFLQDSAFTSINNKSYTNKWNILQKGRFLLCLILHLLVYAIYILYVGFFLDLFNFNFHW